MFAMSSSPLPVELVSASIPSSPPSTFQLERSFKTLNIITERVSHWHLLPGLIGPDPGPLLYHLTHLRPHPLTPPLPLSICQLTPPYPSEHRGKFTPKEGSLWKISQPSPQTKRPLYHYPSAQHPGLSLKQTHKLIWLHWVLLAACGYSLTRGLTSGPPHWELSPSHWATREVPSCPLLKHHHSSQRVKTDFSGDLFNAHLSSPRASLMAQMVKNLPAMWETWVQSFPLEEGTGTHFLPGESMDRGAWHATVHGVTKSPTQLSH